MQAGPWPRWEQRLRAGPTPPARGQSVPAPDFPLLAPLLVEEKRAVSVLGHRDGARGSGTDTVRSTHQPAFFNSRIYK